MMVPSLPWQRVVWVVMLFGGSVAYLFWHCASCPFVYVVFVVCQKIGVFVCVFCQCVLFHSVCVWRCTLCLSPCFNLSMLKLFSQWLYTWLFIIVYCCCVCTNSLFCFRYLVFFFFRVCRVFLSSLEQNKIISQIGKRVGTTLLHLCQYLAQHCLCLQTIGAVIVNLKIAAPWRHGSRISYFTSWDCCKQNPCWHATLESKKAVVNSHLYHGLSYMCFLFSQFVLFCAWIQNIHSDNW